MKIKVGDTIYNSQFEPVMVILSEADKQNIINMLPEATKYCAYPEGTDREFIRAWMGEEEPGEEHNETA